MTKNLTRSEVKDHNSGKSCWIIIGNKVYDVTKFLDEHPGGCEVLLEQAGEDATEVFEDIGHSTDARSMKDEYFIGDIVQDEHKLYSYDQRNWNKSGDNNQKPESSPLEGLVMPVLVALIVGLFYYLLF